MREMKKKIKLKLDKGSNLIRSFNHCYNNIKDNIRDKLMVFVISSSVAKLKNSLSFYTNQFKKKKHTLMKTRYLQISNYHTLLHCLIWTCSSSLRTTGNNMYSWTKTVLKLIDKIFLWFHWNQIIIRCQLLQSLFQSTIIVSMYY